MRRIVELLIVGAVISLTSPFRTVCAPAQTLTGPGTVLPATNSVNTSLADRVPLGIQGTSVRLSAAEIVARMLEKNEERLVALQYYESERTYRVEYTGTGGEHHAEIQVHAQYTEPNQKHFVVQTESGSKFICDKVLRRLIESEQEATGQTNRMQTTLGPENYDAELVGEEMVALPGGQIRTWVLRVKPKVNNKFTYRGKVWVSEDDYAMVKIQGEPAKNPSWWISRTNFEVIYVRRGKVWLPAKNVSSSLIRIGGQATLTITYGSYPVVIERALQRAGNSTDNASTIVAPEH